MDRWEKDPFFAAAEEVQESADRMESTYRTLIHASKEPSVWNSEALKRDLRTALGTTKWQLEEFDRAVVSSYGKTCTENTKERHGEFISAIRGQISRVESSWNETFSTGKPPRPWGVRLDEGERKELAQFLAGSGTPGGGGGDAKTRRKQKASGHRRAASADADIGSWKITVDDNVSPCVKDEKTPRKIPSFSGLLNSLEYSASKLKWPKNDYQKLKQEADGVSLETRGHERSKSCPEDWDENYEKRLDGCCGTIQRLFQRTQYYMLYSCRTKTIFCLVILISLLALLVFLSI